MDVCGLQTSFGHMTRSVFLLYLLLSSGLKTVRLFDKDVDQVSNMKTDMSSISAAGLNLANFSASSAATG